MNHVIAPRMGSKSSRLSSTLPRQFRLQYWLNYTKISQKVAWNEWGVNSLQRNQKKKKRLKERYYTKFQKQNS